MATLGPGAVVSLGWDWTEEIWAKISKGLIDLQGFHNSPYAFLVSKMFGLILVNALGTLHITLTLGDCGTIETEFGSRDQSDPLPSSYFVIRYHSPHPDENVVSRIVNDDLITG
ncbi:uncharacterized protein BDW43DRAFT_315446 [Aspergillus alliaceus]|uniref:uncharacterized protein n=1 Tax=Petromyces alliaceus TaxID=209559 RepID=UPI0012A3C9C1|nr:uncharacterized protein BDW43DRAFT_315446 [Aspergillus alliaceus]KAB8228948.1 hypothetical protein BDW43DRAFT_315446 [Aspergillus alliaceus]